MCKSDGLGEWEEEEEWTVGLGRAQGGRQYSDELHISNSDSFLQRLYGTRGVTIQSLHNTRTKELEYISYPCQSLYMDCVEREEKREGKHVKSEGLSLSCVLHQLSSCAQR